MLNIKIEDNLFDDLKKSFEGSDKSGETFRINRYYPEERKNGRQCLKQKE